MKGRSIMKRRTTSRGVRTRLGPIVDIAGLGPIVDIAGEGVSTRLGPIVDIAGQAVPYAASRRPSRQRLGPIFDIAGAPDGMIGPWRYEVGQGLQSFIQLWTQLGRDALPFIRSRLLPPLAEVPLAPTTIPPRTPREMGTSDIAWISDRTRASFFHFIRVLAPRMPHEFLWGFVQGWGFTGMASTDPLVPWIRWIGQIGALRGFEELVATVNRFLYTPATVQGLVGQRGSGGRGGGGRGGGGGGPRGGGGRRWGGGWGWGYPYPWYDEPGILVLEEEEEDDEATSGQQASLRERFFLRAGETSRTARALAELILRDQGALPSELPSHWRSYVEGWSAFQIGRAHV